MRTKTEAVNSIKQLLADRKPGFSDVDIGILADNLVNMRVGGGAFVKLGNMIFGYLDQGDSIEQTIKRNMIDLIEELLQCVRASHFEQPYSTDKLLIERLNKIVELGWYCKQAVLFEEIYATATRALLIPLIEQKMECSIEPREEKSIYTSRIYQVAREISLNTNSYTGSNYNQVLSVSEKAKYYEEKLREILEKINNELKTRERPPRFLNQPDLKFAIVNIDVGELIICLLHKTAKDFSGDTWFRKDVRKKAFAALDSCIEKLITFLHAYPYDAVSGQNRKKVSIMCRLLMDHFINTSGLRDDRWLSRINSFLEHYDAVTAAWDEMHKIAGKSTYLLSSITDPSSKKILDLLIEKAANTTLNDAVENLRKFFAEAEAKQKSAITIPGILNILNGRGEEVQVELANRESKASVDYYREQESRQVAPGAPPITFPLFYQIAHIIDVNTNQYNAPFSHIKSLIETGKYEALQKLIRRIYVVKNKLEAAGYKKHETRGTRVVTSRDREGLEGGIGALKFAQAELLDDFMRKYPKKYLLQERSSSEALMQWADGYKGGLAYRSHIVAENVEQGIFCWSYQANDVGVCSGRLAVLEKLMDRSGGNDFLQDFFNDYFKETKDNKTCFEPVYIARLIADVKQQIKAYDAKPKLKLGKLSAKQGEKRVIFRDLLDYIEQNKAVISLATNPAWLNKWLQDYQLRKKGENPFVTLAEFESGLHDRVTKSISIFEEYLSPGDLDAARNKLPLLKEALDGNPHEKFINKLAAKSETFLSGLMPFGDKAVNKARVLANLVKYYEKNKHNIVNQYRFDWIAAWANQWSEQGVNPFDDIVAYTGINRSVEPETVRYFQAYIADCLAFQAAANAFVDSPVQPNEDHSQINSIVLLEKALMDRNANLEKSVEKKIINHEQSMLAAENLSDGEIDAIEMTVFVHPSEQMSDQNNPVFLPDSKLLNSASEIIRENENINSVAKNPEQKDSQKIVTDFCFTERDGYLGNDGHVNTILYYHLYMLPPPANSKIPFTHIESLISSGKYSALKKIICRMAAAREKVTLEKAATIYGISESSHVVNTDYVILSHFIENYPRIYLLQEISSSDALLKWAQTCQDKLASPKKPPVNVLQRLMDRSGGRDFLQEFFNDYFAETRDDKTCFEQVYIARFIVDIKRQIRAYEMKAELRLQSLTQEKKCIILCDLLSYIEQNQRQLKKATDPSWLLGWLQNYRPENKKENRGKNLCKNPFVDLAEFETGWHDRVTKSISIFEEYLSPGDFDAARNKLPLLKEALEGNPHEKFINSLEEKTQANSFSLGFLSDSAKKSAKVEVLKSIVQYFQNNREVILKEYSVGWINTWAAEYAAQHPNKNPFADIVAYTGANRIEEPETVRFFQTYIKDCLAFQAAANAFVDRQKAQANGAQTQTQAHATSDAIPLLGQALAARNAAAAKEASAKSAASSVLGWFSGAKAQDVGRAVDGVLQHTPKPKGYGPHEQI